MYLSKTAYRYRVAFFGNMPLRQFSSVKEYDLAVIGGGPGGIQPQFLIFLGYVAAIKASQRGLKTVCIEKRGALGGTCLNVGCIPSKALLNSTHKLEEARHDFSEFGVNVTGISVDFPKLMKYKEKAVNGLTSGVEFLFKKNKVDYVKGWGKFEAKDLISVDTNDGKKEQIKAKNIIIATGSEPSPLPGNVIPIDEKQVVSSTGALTLAQIPKRLVVIGGGVIGLELGSVYRRLGSEVTVVEFMDRICPAMDLDVTTQFRKLLEKQGMKFLLKTKVVGGSSSADGCKVNIEAAAGGDAKTLDCDIVLVSTGRRPFTGGL